MITVFVPCVDTGVSYPDLAWEDYSVGDAIDDCQVVKTISYKSAKSGREALTLAFIAQLEAPPEKEWNCYQLPVQAIQLEIEGVGQTGLGFSFLYTDDLPQINVNVPAGYTPSVEGEFAPMQRVDSEWFTEKFQTYHPQSSSPIPAIYLVWCNQRSPVAA